MIMNCCSVSRCACYTACGYLREEVSPEMNFQGYRDFHRECLINVNIDTCLKTGNYEETVKQLDAYYGLGNRWRGSHSICFLNLLIDGKYF